MEGFLALMVIIGIIAGGFALVNHGEKEKRIRMHGYDWKKPDNQRTPAEQNFINNQRQDEEIKKQFNYIQQGLKYREHKLRVYVAEHGMTEYAINEMDTCLMSLDAFQEYANKLPTSLGSELMNAAKAETYMRARREAAKLSFNGFDEVAEIHKHKEAFEKLFEVINKCKQYKESGTTNITTSASEKATENYQSFDDDII